MAAVSDTQDTAGVEQTRFEEEQEVEEQTKAVSLELPEKEIQQQEKQDQVPASAITFELKAVTITGNESISSKELEPLYDKYLGHQVGMGDLKEIVSRIKQYYRDRGFIAAYVYLPPQNVTEGRIEIAVIEGRVGRVEIKGNRWFSEKLIRRSLRMTAGRILFFEDLRRVLTFLNKNRDLKTRAVLKPGREAKTMDIEITVKDRFPIHLTTDVNNLGTDATGRTRWGVDLTHTNLLGLMDELSGRFQIGSHAYAVGANYNIPITSFQTVLGYSFSYSAVDLGGELGNLNIEGTAMTHGVSIAQPFYDQMWGKVNVTASANLGFDFKSVRNKVLGAKAGVDELRILNTGINFEETDSWGRTLSPHSFHFGFSDFLGSSENVDSAATRVATGGQFFIYRAALLRYHRLPADLIVSVRASVQLTPDRLPSSEQIRLGGAFSVRGYQEGEYLADYGALIQNEIYIPAYFFPKDWKLPYSSQPLRRQIRGVGFFDFGGGSLRHPRTGEESDKFLIGLGGGVRIELFDHVYGRFQWGAPIGDKPNDSTRGTFYYGISAELF